jgi:hypothetical protein
MVDEEMHRGRALLLPGNVERNAPWGLVYGSNRMMVDPRDDHVFRKSGFGPTCRGRNVEDPDAFANLHVKPRDLG